MNRLATYFGTFAAIFTLALWASSPALAQVEIEVAAGQNTILDAVAQASPGDILVLTDSGGEYLNDGRIDIEFPLTIRAADGLDEKPVIKNNEPDEDTRVIFESSTISPSRV